MLHFRKQSPPNSKILLDSRKPDPKNIRRNPHPKNPACIPATQPIITTSAEKSGIRIPKISSIGLYS